MEKAIKIKDKEDFLKVEEILIENGLKTNEDWNLTVSNDMINDKSQHYIVIYKDEIFNLHNHSGSKWNKIYNNVNDFLEEWK